MCWRTLFQKQQSLLTAQEHLMESQSENISAQGREHLMEEYLYMQYLTGLFSVFWRRGLAKGPYSLLRHPSLKAYSPLLAVPSAQSLSPTGICFNRAKPFYHTADFVLSDYSCVVHVASKQDVYCFKVRIGVGSITIRCSGKEPVFLPEASTVDWI